MSKKEQAVEPYAMFTFEHGRVELGGVVQKYFPKGIGEAQPGIVLGTGRSDTTVWRTRRFKRVLTCTTDPGVYAAWHKQGCKSFRCGYAMPIQPLVHQTWSLALHPFSEKHTTSEVICVFRGVRMLAGEGDRFGFKNFPGTYLRQEHIQGFSVADHNGELFPDTVALIPINARFSVQSSLSLGHTKTYVWDGKNINTFR